MRRRTAALRGSAEAFRRSDRRAEQAIDEMLAIGEERRSRAAIDDRVDEVLSRR